MYLDDSKLAIAQKYSPVYIQKKSKHTMECSLSYRIIDIVHTRIYIHNT